MRLYIVLGMVAAFVPVVTQGFAATAYTDRAAFDSAISGFTGTTVVNFDAHRSGYQATNYDIMSISANGLASDGYTYQALSPIETSAFSTVSVYNALGVSGMDNSFLAGNSDVIRFQFSQPIYAFGLYMIGNPSPTGNQPIPFWRIHVNTASGCDAYSDTDPIYNLGSGNDVYFLGIVSTDQSFTLAELYSNNDLAAVFSFNCDDVVHAGLPDEVTIPQAKAITSGYVRISGVVTRAHEDRFNIETPDRLAGIAVMGAGAARGTAVTLLGNVTMNEDGEQMIELDHIISSVESNPPGTLAMGTMSVGGSTAVGLQIGVPGSIGPNNIGLDACVWGKITTVSSDLSWFTLDDGSHRPLQDGITGVVIIGPNVGQGKSTGQFVTVRGSVSIVDSAHHFPAIRVADPINDIAAH
ncbi:MAG: hypothetical protein ACYC64_08080 [Armatimonadota bacterium]